MFNPVSLGSLLQMCAVFAVVTESTVSLDVLAACRREMSFHQLLLRSWGGGASFIGEDWKPASARIAFKRC